MSRAFPAQGDAVRIRCKRCGWQSRVARSEAGTEIVYHRDVTCTEKPAPAEGATRSLGSIGKPTKRQPRRHAKRRRQFCPTCREELFPVNDALTCTQGCTNLATRM